MFQLQLFFLLHCDEWDRVVALPRHKFVTGATLLQLKRPDAVAAITRQYSDHRNQSKSNQKVLFKVGTFYNNTT